MNVNELQKYLNDNDIPCIVWWFSGYETKGFVDIIWGDWKHSHLRAKHLLDKAGWTVTKTIVTEENGSDCYSARHIIERSEK